MSGGCPPAEAGLPTVGVCAALACLWEATAPKPGNVYRGADFEDLTYVDFLTSAAVVGPVLEQTRERGVGATVLEAVQRTRAAVQTNTNLGILLLLAPLSAVPQQETLAGGIDQVLQALTRQDAEQVFEAIRTAQPGGLGTVEDADVHDTAPVQLSLLEAMRLAAQRDLIALQYTNKFEQVFQAADCIETTYRRDLPLSDAIVYACLRLLADHPDSLIARKCGEPIAQDVANQAAAVLAAGNPGQETYERAVREFDFSLRVDGHQRNPGTSADLIAAGLFVLLRENRLDWPVRFYGNQESAE
ncbi:MAG: triphosphoribosyl-dephospho-CoA synthase [Bythopirellula sp.]